MSSGKVSVVLISYNEAVSVVFRTIYSAINRSPRHLLHEFILYDDGSIWGNWLSLNLILFLQFSLHLSFQALFWGNWLSLNLILYLQLSLHISFQALFWGNWLSLNLILFLQLSLHLFSGLIQTWFSQLNFPYILFWSSKIIQAS